MAKIDKLTTAQEQRLVEFREEWFRIGICTDRADQRTAEAAITAMYKRIGRPPARFLWCESPARCLQIIQAVKNNSLGNSLTTSLWGALGRSLGDSLQDSLAVSLQNLLWASLTASPLRDSLLGSLGRSPGYSLEDSLWGQHEAYWVSFHLFCRDVVGAPYDEVQSADLNLWRDLAQSCCWWWPYQNWCVVSERPTAVHLNDRGRLHHESGPALTFADGWSAWFWQGVHVPQSVIESPQSISVKQIRAEQNAEIRRVMIERIGWPRYLRETKSRTIHRCRNHIEATEEALVDSPDGKVLVCACPSTAKVFALPVPNEIATCEQAQWWLSNGLSHRTISAS